MAHTPLLPQPLEKSDKRYDYHIISKEFGTNPQSPTTPKASPTSTPNRLTTQNIINASLRK